MSTIFDVGISLENFHQDGFLVVPNVFDEEEVASFCTEAMVCFHEVLEEKIRKSGSQIGIGIKHGFKEIVQRHDKRFEMPYKMKEIGAEKFANNSVLKCLADGILGKDEHHIVNVSLVVSAPGTSDQGWHADGPHVSVTEHLPCHVFNAFIPLVDVDMLNGPTAFRPESHYYTIDLQKKFMLAAIKKKLRPVQTPTLKRGSILLFDYRVLHRGTANLTDKHRPILVITFGKKWYQDTLNFPSNSVYDLIPESNGVEGEDSDEIKTKISVDGNDDVGIFYRGVWSHSRAKELEVTQLSTSGCGATAVMTVLRYLEPDRKISSDEVLGSSTLRTRKNDAPLPEYLASRSVAGCTGEEVIEAVNSLSSTLSSFKSPSEFSKFYPACSNKDLSYLRTHELAFPDISRDFMIDGRTDLIEWISDHLSEGNCLVATLNLQLLQNDAWHHQFIYGVDRKTRTIFCTNPLESYPEELFKSFLSTPSVLLVKQEDILKRYKGCVSNDEERDIYTSDPRWKELQVVSQIEKVIAGERKYVMIPAAYKGGIALFRKYT